MGKDTTIGHWEIAGVVSPKPLPTFPNGFPEDVYKRQLSDHGARLPLMIKDKSMGRKLIFLDIDGTLLPPGDMLIPESTRCV